MLPTMRSPIDPSLVRISGLSHSRTDPVHRQLSFRHPHFSGMRSPMNPQPASPPAVHTSKHRDDVPAIGIDAQFPVHPRSATTMPEPVPVPVRIHEPVA